MISCHDGGGRVILGPAVLAAQRVVGIVDDFVDAPGVLADNACLFRLSFASASPLRLLGRALARTTEVLAPIMPRGSNAGNGHIRAKRVILVRPSTG